MNENIFDETKINIQTIINAYKFLNHEKQTEIRIFSKNKIPESKFITNEKELAFFCNKNNGNYNISMGIHERKKDGTSGRDVKSIQTLIIDIDPIREKDTNSTPEQIQQANEIAETIISDFKKEGYNEPIKIFSGNGIHLWFAFPKIEITEENREELQEKIKELYRLLKKYETETIKIDNIGDLARVIRIPGTLNIKAKPILTKCLSEKFERKEDKKLRELILSIKTPKKEIKKTNTEFNPKLSLIITYDKKLKKLMQNDSETTKKYKSRSEREAAIISKLCLYNFSYEEINEIMKKENMTKWIESREEYRKRTYEKVKEFTEKINKNSLQEYLSIKVKSLIMYPGKEDTLFKIYINENKIIELNKMTIMNTKEFIAQYYIQSQVMLSKLKEEVWAKLITYWTKEFGKIVHKTEKLNEEQIIIEKIIEEIENFLVVDDIELCDRYGKVYLEEDTVLISGKTIETIIKKNNLNIKLTKLAFWLDDYLQGKTEQRRIRKKRIRFWKFKKEKLDLDYENIIKTNKEKDEEND